MGNWKKYFWKKFVNASFLALFILIPVAFTALYAEDLSNNPSGVQSFEGRDAKNVRTIYVYRHGQRPDGANTRLTELGQKQARLVGERVLKRGFNGKIYVSPYIRTIETARPLAELSGNKLIPAPAFQEIVRIKYPMEEYYSPFLKEQFPNLISDDVSLQRGWLIKPDKNETDYDTGVRFYAGLKKILADGEKGDIAIITHGANINGFAQIIANKTGKTIKGYTWNCALFVFQTDGKDIWFKDYDVSYFSDEDFTANFSGTLSNPPKNYKSKNTVSPLSHFDADKMLDKSARNRKKFSAKAVFGDASSISAALLPAKDAGFAPIDLKAGDNFTNPLGSRLGGIFGDEGVGLSWKLPPVKDGLKQSAYRVRAASSAKNLESGVADIWDSGKVLSDNSAFVILPKALESREKIYWNVEVWDGDGAKSRVSETAFFEAGLLSNSDWLGKWIRADFPAEKGTVASIDSKWEYHVAERRFYAPALFRREFSLPEKRVVQARLYITSRGIFTAYLNGEKIGDEFWNPGWTNYFDVIQTCTFDVSKKLSSGEKKFVLSAEVADGWYSGRLHKTGITQPYGERPELLVQLEITYSDSSKDVIFSDSSWRVSKGATTFADIYDGQDFDARLEQKNWNCVAFDDSSWSNAVSDIITVRPLLLPRAEQPIRECAVVEAKSVREVSDGVYIFDLGQNLVGVERIKVPAKSGKKISVNFAEILEPDGTLHTRNYRSARSADSYIPSADGQIDWSPEFTFHGFRYVQISGLEKGLKLSTSAVSASVLHNDMPITGTFACSEPLVNKLYENIVWGQKGNFFSVPTDCPQRDERLGWTGDAQIFCPTAAFNMDVLAFFDKWLLDVRLAQFDTGEVPHIVPEFRASGRGGSPAWDDAAVICPWEIYLAYGDKSVLRENYNMMKKRVAYQLSVCQPNTLLAPHFGYGDWLEPYAAERNGTTSRAMIGTAYMVRCADILSKTAKILGYEDDAKYYSALREKVRKQFVKTFVVNKDSGELRSKNQTPYLMALAWDILPKKMRRAALDRLTDSLDRADNHLRTGFVGTPLINPVLARFGLNEKAYELLLKKTYPSWLYPVTQGATTMWERWNGWSSENGFAVEGYKSNSFNHYAYGSIGEWLFRSVAGIWSDPNNAGYKNIIFAPTPDKRLGFAKASHETPYGTASSEWKYLDTKSGANWAWDIVIPPNSTGMLVFPSKDIESIVLDGKPLDKSLLKKHLNGLYRLDNVQSGKHSVQCRAF